MKIDPELRTAAFVPRWSIVWTLYKDNVANHSFYVALYSNMVADIIGWKGSRGYLLMAALLHDIEELLTGDITGPVKKEILDKAKALAYAEHMTDERLNGAMESLYALEDELSDDEIAEATRIIKAADLLDALFFLTIEYRRGNGVVSGMVGEMQGLVEAAWRSLPASKDVIDRTWNTTMIPTIRAHETSGGRGV